MDLRKIGCEGDRSKWKTSTYSGDPSGSTTRGRVS